MSDKEKRLNTALIIGRWQPWHKGHRELFKAALSRAEKVAIGVRATFETDGKNPFSFEEVKKITNDSTKKCSFNPSKDWALIGPNIKFPVGYKICLSSTPLAESNYLELQNSGKPGIYVLHAIPNVTNARYLPMRKIFCRPKPYC